MEILLALAAAVAYGCRTSPAASSPSGRTSSWSSCCPSGTVALSRNAPGKPSKWRLSFMEGRQERVEPLDPAYDLSSFGSEVEAVARGDRSMQQCRPDATAPWPLSAGAELDLVAGLDARRLLGGLPGRDPLGDHRAVAGGVDDARLQPGVVAAQDALGGRVVAGVVVGPQVVEEPLDPAAGAPAEQLGQLDRLLGRGRAVVDQHPGPHAGGADREQLGADVDDPAQEPLLALQPALPAGHAVEGRAGEPPAGPLHEAQVGGEPTELLEAAGDVPLADGQLGQPAGVEAAGRRGRPGLAGEAGLRVDQAAGDREVLVDRLAGDEQVHDLGRALEDAVDAQVAQTLLGADRALAAGGQRGGRLIAAPTAQLDQLVGDQPGH